MTEKMNATKILDKDYLEWMGDKNKTTLKDKVQFVIETYNGGINTSYAENMLFAIEEAENGNKEYEIGHDNVLRKVSNLHRLKMGPEKLLVWDLAGLIGECLLNNTEYLKRQGV